MLHVRSNYISLVKTSYYIFIREYATLENIAAGVHSVKYFSITNILYILTRISLTKDTALSPKFKFISKLVFLVQLVLK